MKLELKHLKSYLDHNIDIMMLSAVDGSEPNIEPLTGIQYDGLALLGTGGRFGFYQREFFAIKPILKPMSDLTRKELEEAGFNSHIDYLTYENQGAQWTLRAPFEMVEYLFSKHYDVYELIKSKLAVNINTVYTL